MMIDFEISNNLLAAFLSFFFLIILFLPLEKVFPAKKNQKIFRPHWFLDLCFFLGQYLLWGVLLISIMAEFKAFLQGYVSVDILLTVADFPFYVQILLVLLISDFLIYWGHRLQHANDFLWRFHKVHHSAEHLDWLAAHREHPLDTVYTVGLINLPAFMIGFPLEAIAGVIAFRGIWAIYIHSNVRLPIGPLRILIGAPELHHWHHDYNRRAGNYANISPIMDVLFGTYTCPDEEPEKFGISEKLPKTYVGQLIEPLLPNSIKRKIFNR